MNEQQSNHATNEELRELAQLIAAAQSNAESARRLLRRIAERQGCDLAVFATVCVICADEDFGFSGGYQLEGDRFVCQGCWQHLSDELEVFNSGPRRVAQESALIH